MVVLMSEFNLGRNINYNILKCDPISNSGLVAVNGHDMGWGSCPLMAAILPLIIIL